MIDELEIVYEDAHLLVVNKPSGLTSVPGKGVHAKDSLTTRVLQRYPMAPMYPAVHRLDMDTSGLMLFALHAEALKGASKLFEQRRVHKRYIAVLDGRLVADGGTIELPFRLDPDDRPRQIYDTEHGKMGTSHWRVLERDVVVDAALLGKDEDGIGTRVEFEPVTGRTHQLRLHASHALGLGAPIVGDCLYGTGQRHGELRLHASHLSFEHPIHGEPMEWHSAPSW
ncbi:RluA family pseudouridine synthase [Rubritalea marina]|uniref:RluA family pseudouridine synthase n=1 Tax=Rubritalea marina TaxID=361055 RepID=UPI0003676A2B|nr:RluA family pseudouridine synthase [Rubritalea marina]